MADDPFWLKILTKLGVNTTQLRWKLYQLERKAKQAKTSGPLPSGLSWLKYEHKICRHCGAVNDRDSRACHRCGKRMPSVLGYKLFRIGGLMLPQTAPVTATMFIAVIVMYYAAGMVVEGMSALIQGPSSQLMLLMGSFTNLLPDGLGTVWWRWLSFSFVHAGLIHIGFNVFATTQIGPLIENQIGRKRMLVVITGCQLAAAAATVFWYEQLRGTGFNTIGASGWVFGLIGFGVAYFHRMGDAGTMYRNALVRWIIYGVIFGLIFPVNNAAHLGGALGGALLAYLPEGKGHKQARLEERTWNVLAGVCLALWIATLCFSIWFAFTNRGALEG